MSSTAFSRLFAEHVGFVWRVLLRHGVPARELEDACQEVFIVVFRRLPEFEGRSTLQTWIYGVAVRVAIGLRRRAYFRRELLTDTPPEIGAAANAYDALIQTEARSLLVAAFAALPRPKREVFVLYELEGMTMAEVAAALRVPENTALYRLYGAREDVRAFVRKAGVHAGIRGVRAREARRQEAKRLNKRVAP